MSFCSLGTTNEIVGSAAYPAALVGKALNGWLTESGT